jgi:hypothetical protein
VNYLSTELQNPDDRDRLQKMSKPKFDMESRQDGDERQQAFVPLRSSAAAVRGYWCSLVS